MQEDLKDIFRKCYQEPAWEAEHVCNRPLRGVQAEIIHRVEKFIAEHKGGVMTILSARQTGKNETAANLQRRHLWRNQHAPNICSWIRTAPTHEPQIVNSKKRLEELCKLDRKNVAHDPMFLGGKIQKTEGYIWRFGNATVEFMSSGAHSNVVGATASECLDMDEAHEIDKSKFDQDFAPFTASTNAGALLWGVASDGLDTIETYRQLNRESGDNHLNLYYPCDIWAEISPTYRAHVEGRVRALGWDHPIIKTQYRLIPVAQEGAFFNKGQTLSLLGGEHGREPSPRPGRTYEICIDLAAGNEDFNPGAQLIGDADADGYGQTQTDSTVVWVYEVTDEICQNNIYPVIRIVNLYWWTGVPLPQQEIEIKSLIRFWRASKVTVDGVGVGRQLAESLEQSFGVFMVNKYIANSTSISEDCFDLLARLNYDAVKMFQNDGSREYEEFARQVSWTKYASKGGKMTLSKPASDKHIDMVKALTYVNRNRPDNSPHVISSNPSEY
jgi:hypothetical protein